MYELIKFVRHPFKAHKLIGCVAAVGEGTNFAIGWSQCNEVDDFDKTIGKNIATGRARKILNNPDFVSNVNPINPDFVSNINPKSVMGYNPDGSVFFEYPIQEAIEEMFYRAQRYFKDG